MGYKYETRYEDFVTGNWQRRHDYAYGDIVAYPFGYGMSYTDFDISDMNVSYNAAVDTYTVTVKVTNTRRHGRQQTRAGLCREPSPTTTRKTVLRSRLPFLWSASARPT